MSSLYAVGSGLDIPTIVSQLVAADRSPIENRINTQGTAATSKLSALGTIKSGLSNIQSSLKSLNEALSTPTFKTTVAEGAGFTASSTSTATTGSYNIEVVSLAKAQKLTSEAFASDKLLGSGTLTLTIGEKTLEIASAADTTLASLAREINRVSEGKGVTASVITTDAGQHLVLSATETGDAGAISLSAVMADGETEPDNVLSQLTWDKATTTGTLRQSIEPTKAKVLIDGLERTGSSNSFTDLIEGVTITLTKETSGTPHNVSLATDSTQAKTAMQAFVASYNSAMTVLRSSSSYNSETKTSSALTGDSMVRGLQNQLRSIIGGANINDLKPLGLSVSKDGTLSFDSSAFDKTRSEQPELAAAVFGKEGRITTTLNTLLTNNLDSAKGTLVLRTETLNKQIKKLEQELDDLDARMLRNKERYTKQFTSMDSLVASMQSTSNYLTQQLANLSSSKN